MSMSTISGDKRASSRFDGRSFGDKLSPLRHKHWSGFQAESSRKSAPNGDLQENGASPIYSIPTCLVFFFTRGRRQELAHPLSARNVSHHAATSRRLQFFVMAAISLLARESDCAEPPEFTLSQEVSVGGMARVGGRDRALIGGGNSGTGTSINYDDGNLNYGRGFTAIGVQGRTAVDGKSGPVELHIEAVYFYDFINADGKTEFRPLSDEARVRAGRNLYLNEAYVGFTRASPDATLRLRLGNQILRWSDSPYFGYSIAPVNPIAASRRYQPGNAPKDSYVALPMLTGKVVTATNWSLSAFYQLGFKPSEPEAAGTFLSGNDYYSPGARYIQLGVGSPLVPDIDSSIVTPATPFGSRVPRAADHRPSSAGQFGARIETPEFGPAKVSLAVYAMRVHTREPIVSVSTGTLGGLLRTTAADYTSSGNYFVEYVPHLTVVGASARLTPAAFTRLNLDYSMRLRQPLQIDDDLLITAGLAPAGAAGACAPNPAGAICTATLLALNRNPLIAARGGITAANAASFFASEIGGYERYDMSQYAISLTQGLPPVLFASRWLLAAEAGGVRIHGFKDRFLDASVSSRLDAVGGRRPGFATPSSWGYRISTRLDYANLMGAKEVSPSLTWIHDVHGNAPITLGTVLEGSKSVIVAVDFGFQEYLSARVSYRSYLGKGNDADRYTDRDFVQFSLTKKF